MDGQINMAMPRMRGRAGVGPRWQQGIQAGAGRNDRLARRLRHRNLQSVQCRAGLQRLCHRTEACPGKGITMSDHSARQPPPVNQRRAAAYGVACFNGSKTVEETVQAMFTGQISATSLLAVAAFLVQVAAQMKLVEDQPKNA
jgi:hypothetical protein